MTKLEREIRRDRARKLALSGCMAAVTSLLLSAADTFAQDDVGTVKIQESAKRVQKACATAIMSISGDMLERPGGERVVKDSILRGTIKISGLFLEKAKRHMSRGQLYCGEFVGARLMACNLTVNSMRMRHRGHFGKEFKKLDNLSATLLSRVIPKMAQHEALMFQIARDFEEEVFIP